MNYEEIMKCYESETDIHASTSFEFGLMNDLYYQLFYSYPEVDNGSETENSKSQELCFFG